MCLLTFLPAGVLPDLDALYRGAARNPDGHGLAILIPAHRSRPGRQGRGSGGRGRLIVRHDLNPDRLIQAMDQLRRHHLDGPALFHSRLATSGRPGLANCHPFPVDHDRRTVLAHNGILPPDLHPQRRDTRCDTRIAAEEFTTRFGPAHSPQVQRRLERAITPFNKIVILSVDPAFTRPAIVLNEDAGTWRQGIWYSNDDYQPSRRRDHRVDHRADHWRDLGPDPGPWHQTDTAVGSGDCPRCGEPVTPAPARADTRASSGCGWCWWWTCHRCGLVLDDCLC